jgi:hypothetical protein
MKARAKKSHKPVRAFTGLEFVSYEWRPIPDGCEDEAARLADWGYLELQYELDDVGEIRIEATDAAFELAGELGIDLETVSGTGADGRIVLADVRAHAFAVDEEE